MVVFDMAGTTVNEDNVVYKTLRASLEAYGHTFTLEQVLALGAGKEKLRAIEDLLRAGGPQAVTADAGTIFQHFQVALRQAYEELDVEEMPGATQAFQRLRAHGCKVVLNTGYDRAIAEGLVAKMGWRIGVDIDDLVTASEVKQSRPCPDMVFLAMQRMGITEAGAVAKVGDSVVDIEEGKNAGCGLCVGITTGAQARELLASASPDRIVDSLGELVDLVLGVG